MPPWGFLYLGPMDIVPSLALSQSLEHQEPAPLCSDLTFTALLCPSPRSPFHHHPCAQGDAVLSRMFLLSSFSMEAFSPKGVLCSIFTVSNLQWE